MNKRGSIATFESQHDAQLAGYSRPLTASEAAILMPLPRAERLARYDAMYGMKPNDRARSAAKAARKARRKNRR